MAKVIISIPTAKGLMFLLGVNFEKSEITMKAPSSEHIFTEEFVLQENQTKYHPVLLRLLFLSASASLSLIFQATFL